MHLNHAYDVTEAEIDVEQIHEVQEGSAVSVNEKVFTYDDAMKLAGNGWYNYGLGVALAMCLLSMFLDIYGVSVIVPLVSCHFGLNLKQVSILMTTPFIGACCMAYVWGYIADTQGRRKSLLIGLFSGFVVSFISAFSPNWIVFGVAKIISCGLSSCAQSITFTLLGESCTDRVKSASMLAMSSILHYGGTITLIVGYFLGDLDFSYDLGYIKMVSWRLLAVIFSLPLAFSAVSLTYFYESPLFLLNVGRNDQAVNLLKKICRRNGRDADNYPVKKLHQNEAGNELKKDVTLMGSLKQQTIPLFKPPLLFNTVRIYILIFIIYGTCNSLFVWLIYLSKAFDISNGKQGQILCEMIVDNRNETTKNEGSCRSELVTFPILIFRLTLSVTFNILIIIMSKFASRKKLLMIIFFTIACASCFGTMFIRSNIANLIFFYGIVEISVCMGVVFSYFVVLFPTSVRGMASCLGVMVSRLSSIFFISIVGPYLTTECDHTMYGLSALIVAAFVVCCLLPPDRNKNVSQN